MDHGNSQLGNGNTGPISHGAHHGVADAFEFEHLCKTCVTSIRVFLLRCGCLPSSLDDLTQEVLLRAWSGRNGFQGKASVQTWLLAIARNVACEWRRKHFAPIKLDPGSLMTEVAIGQVIDDQEQSELVRHAVRQLPPKQQQAVQLIYYDGLEPIAAAIRAKCSQKVLHQRLADARKQLRRLLDKRSSRLSPS